MIAASIEDNIFLPVIERVFSCCNETVGPCTSYFCFSFSFAKGIIATCIDADIWMIHEAILV